MIEPNAKFTNRSDDKFTEFLIAAFMLKVMKYGNRGMNLKMEDFESGKLVGKTIKVQAGEDGKSYKFTVVNDPRN